MLALYLYRKSRWQARVSSRAAAAVNSDELLPVVAPPSARIVVRKSASADRTEAALSGITPAAISGRGEPRGPPAAVTQGIRAANSAARAEAKAAKAKAAAGASARAHCSGH